MLKKSIFALSATASLLAAPVLAEEIDMSDPTDAYTSFGVGYGNEGLNLKFTAMLSNPAEAHKEIFIIEANDILDEEGKDSGRFSGLGQCKDGSVGFCSDNKLKNRNFRFRWGTMNKTNGLGVTVDTIVAEHPVFGQMTIAQFGGLSTLPVAEGSTLWVLLLVGGVIVEDNMALYNSATPAIKSSGVDWASTVYSAKLYARHKFTNDFWFLGSLSYTDEMKGKSWNESIARGGLQIRPFQFEGIWGYQLTQTQNITFKYKASLGDGSSDKLTLEYNHAF